MKDKILEYINSEYRPHTIILYGSYADGSNNFNSDFDALIITDYKNNIKHDGRVVNGVLLDLFIYSTEDFKSNINYEQYVQIYDGNIVLDEYGIGKELKESVISFIKSRRCKSKEEKEHEVEWCEKMLLRTERDDAEGYFRWHWILVDSLEIYFMIQDEYYYGPKKSLLKMQRENTEAYELYNNALTQLDYEALRQWVKHLRGMIT